MHLDGCVPTVTLRVHWKYSGRTWTRDTRLPKAVHVSCIVFWMKSATLSVSRCCGLRGIKRHAYDMSYARFSKGSNWKLLAACADSLLGLPRLDFGSGGDSDSARPETCVDDRGLDGGT